MSITIKEIARLAGVSIGTVDRVLHDRGRVKPETAVLIRKIAGEHGFTPSRAGRALALARKPVKIGIVVHLTKTEFMQQTLQGIAKVKAELKGLGAEILVREIASFDVQAQLQALDDLVGAGAQGIAISPAEDQLLRGKLDELVSEKELPVVTFNTDMPGSKRMTFVGLDNIKSGQAAAGLMGIATGGSGKIGVLTGYLGNQACNARIEGFRKEIGENFPKLCIKSIQPCNDENPAAEKLTMQMLEDIPDLAGLLVCAGGQAGVRAGLKKLKMEGKIKVITYDLIPSTIEGLQSGVIDFVIDQNSFWQGYRPAMILYEKLFMGKKAEKEYMYTDILIKTKYNI